MKVFIVTEGTAKTGFGHISRCTALYQAFEERGYLPKFIVNGDDSAKELLRGYEVSFFDWTKETNKLYEQINNLDVVIIDSYLADIEIYEAISRLAKRAVYIDDYLRLDYPKGIVVNGTIYAEELPYPKKEGVEYLLGNKYIILRKEFWDVPEKEIREKISKVLITFGGSDTRNLTPRVLYLLVKNYPLWEKHVVIGSAFSNAEEIKKVSDKNTIIHYVPNAENMKKLMLECDLAISAAGQTINELARCGLPSVIIQTADNQKENVRGWIKADFLLSLSYWNTVDGNIFKKDLFNFRKRKDVSKVGAITVDGTGSKNIISALLI